MKIERYQIKVRGLINESWPSYFSGMTVSVETIGLTRISGTITDQSALYGLLSKIRDLNLKLVSVQLLDSDGITPVDYINCPLNKPSKDRNKPENTPLDG